MSTINDSLRRLEQRGALGQAALPPGVTPGAARPTLVPVQFRQTGLILALVCTTSGLLWSEWTRRHAEPVITAPVPASVQVQVPAAAPAPIPPVPPVPPVPPAPPAPAAQSPIQVPDQVTVAQAAPKAAPVVSSRSPTDSARAEEPRPSGSLPGPLAGAVSDRAVSSARPPQRGESGPLKSTAVGDQTELASSPAAPSEARAQVSAGSHRKTPMAMGKQISPAQKADELYLQALQRLQDSRGSDARIALEEALELNPAQANARQLLAALRVEDRQLGRAETLLTDGLPYHPPASALVALARLKVERGEEGGALRLLLDNLSVGALDGDYQALVAALQLRQGHLSEAVQHYRLAIEQQPAQGPWWAGLGLALAGQKDRRSEAIQALKQARASGKLPSALSDRVDSQLLTLLRSEEQP